MNEQKGWYQRGWDNLDDFKREYSNQPRRLWMPKESSKKVIFLDDNPFRFYEHQLYLNGSWQNWFTCLKQGETSRECPLCKMDDNPYYVGMYTIVDMSEYFDKKGNQHKNELRIFAAKIDTMKLLKLKKERMGSLVGCKFEISRVGEKSPSVGNNFEYVEKLTMEQVDELVNKDRGAQKLEVKPFAYEEIFAPPSEESLLTVVRRIKERKTDSVRDEETGQPEY